MILVVDCSIAIKWIAEESNSAEARKLLPSWNGDNVNVENILVAPSLILFEAHHVMAKRFNTTGVGGQRTVAGEQVAATVAQIIEHVAIEPLDDQLASLAAEIANTTLAQSPPSSPHNIYDCVYVALAKRLGASLATADKIQCDIARSFGIDVKFFGLA